MSFLSLLAVGRFIGNSSSVTLRVVVNLKLLGPLNLPQWMLLSRYHIHFPILTHKACHQGESSWGFSLSSFNQHKVIDPSDQGDVLEKEKSELLKTEL